MDHLASIAAALEADMARERCSFCGWSCVASRPQAALDELRSHLLDCPAFGLRPVLRAAVRIRITAHDLLERYERFMARPEATVFLTEDVHDSLDRLRAATQGRNGGGEQEAHGRPVSGG